MPVTALYRLHRREGEKGKMNKYRAERVKPSLISSWRGDYRKTTWTIIANWRETLLVVVHTTYPVPAQLLSGNATLNLSL